MGRFLFNGIQFYVMIYLLTICCSQAENSRGPKRTKVSPYAGMIPFLRTGRSRYQLPITDLENYDDKRAKSGRTIMAFPRVGRTGAMDLPYESGAEKKNNANNNNGLWFGPRLGRIHKRQEYKKDVPVAYVYFGEYTPRLGRESEEFMEDVDGYPDEKENDKSVLETA